MSPVAYQDVQPAELLDGLLDEPLLSVLLLDGAEHAEHLLRRDARVEDLLLGLLKKGVRSDGAISIRS